MSLQTSNSTTHNAQIVGNAFVEQYYHILHTSPELGCRFYQESSVISRPDANGVMASVSTMEGINQKILSLNLKDYRAEIRTADAQKSHEDGVTVLVTGNLTGKDNLKKKFVQSFFLAPQDNGYFVLNDVFRYVDDAESLENHPASWIDSTPTNALIPDPEPSYVPDPSALEPLTIDVEEDINVVEKATDTLENEKQFVHEKEVAVESQSHSNGNDVSVAVESASSAAQYDAPKKSYASIVKVARGSSGPTKVYVATNVIKAAPKKNENRPVSVAPAPDPEPSAPSTNDTPESSSTQDEVEGHSIYIRNLPFYVTATQLEAEFKKFGPIKQGGIQVRYNKQQGYCFGFVEFQSLTSMNKAIQASPMTIGGHQAVIEIKRTTTRVGSGRGRFPSGRAGFRSDSFRSRGSSGGGRGYGRNEFGNKEFSGHGRNSSGRGEGYQQGRGRGRGGRSSAGKPDANST